MGNLTLADGSITDSGGDISFSDNNLSTNGTLDCGVLTAATGSSVGNLTLADGSITDSGGDISFSDNNLSTTGDIKLGGTTINPNLILRNEGRIEAHQLSLTDASTEDPGMNIHFQSDGRMIIAHDTNDDPTHVKIEAVGMKLHHVDSNGDDVHTLQFDHDAITHTSGTISFDDENLTTTGDVTASNYHATSDRRLKQNIEYTNANDSLQQVLAMKPVTYQFKTTPSVHRQGVIAQDLQEIAPHLVTTVHKDTDNEHLAVNYLDIISSLIGAVQALNAEITVLKQQIV